MRLVGEVIPTNGAPNQSHLAVHVSHEWPCESSNHAVMPGFAGGHWGAPADGGILCNGCARQCRKWHRFGMRLSKLQRGQTMARVKNGVLLTT
eukprot:1140026-Pelagomonas_calceolata.AAC.10